MVCSTALGLLALTEILLALISLLAWTKVLLGLVEVAGCLAESNKGEVFEVLCIPQMLWLCLLPLLHSCLVTPLVEHPHANAEQALIRLVRDQPYSRLFPKWI